jgi:HSP20 family protein
MSRQLARLSRRLPRMIDREMASMWKPFDLWRDFDTSTPSLFTPPSTAWNEESSNFIAPSVDVREKNDKFEIIAELPGVRKENLNVDIDEDNRVVTLRGETSSEKDEGDEKYHYRERSYGSFQRSFSLPDNAKLEDIKASMKDGLLRLDIPKMELSEKSAGKTRKLDILEDQSEESSSADKDNQSS